MQPGGSCGSWSWCPLAGACKSREGKGVPRGACLAAGHGTAHGTEWLYLKKQQSRRVQKVAAAEMEQPTVLM